MKNHFEMFFSSQSCFRSNRTFFLLLVSIFFSLQISSYSQTTYYLDKDNPNASDNNAGSNPNFPWLTWNKAVNTAQAGDIVIIKKSASSYIPTSNTYFNNSGTVNNRIVFKGENPNDRPVIDYQNNKNFSANNIQYVTWEDLEIRNTGNGVWTQGSNYLIFKDIFINGCASGSTLRFQGDYNIVEYCEITGSKWNAITIMSNSHNTANTSDDWRCRGNIIRYNYVHDNTAHHSINIFPYVSPGNSDLMPQYIDSTQIYGNRLENSNWGIYSRYMRAFKIYNNLIINCTEGGIQLERNYDSGNAGSPDSSRYGTYDAKGGIIANNTIYNCKSSYGCAIDDRACDNVMFYNNAIWNSASTSDNVQWRFYNPTASSAPAPFNHHPINNLIIDHNMTSSDGGNVLWNGGSKTSVTVWNSNYCTNGFIETPQIETTGTDTRWNVSGSFIPQKGSNVLDNGYTGSLGFIYDYYGNPRVQNSACDIGAIELITGPDTTAPKVISASLTNPTTLVVDFSEAMDPISSVVLSNYSIGNGISINSASLSNDGKSVTLNTSQHIANQNYIITVNNVKDLAGNIISNQANNAQYVLNSPSGNLNKLSISTATASSDPEPNHDAAKAIDGLGYYSGDPDSRWADNPLPEWISFDLGGLKYVSRTRLSFYNFNNGRIYNFTISVSKDNVTWDTVVQNAKSSSNEWTLTDFAPIQARYVRVTCTSSNQDNWAGIWEAEVWGKTAISDQEQNQINSYQLLQNYPNPFNPSTKIEYIIPNSSYVQIKVYSIIGKEVKTLVNKFQQSGVYNIRFDASGLAAGVYFYRIIAGEFIQTKKMVLLK